MRRTDREITDFEKMLSVADACDCCRLGFVDGDEAYIVPLNFGYEVQDNTLILYFHGASEGRKLSLAKKSKLVSFEMDTGHALTEGATACAYSYLYQSLMGKGTITVLTDYEEKLHALRRIMEHYSDKGEWSFQEKVVNMVSVMRLEVTALSCKEHSGVPAKHGGPA